MELLKELQIKTNNMELYYEALRHPSYNNENHLKDNHERLEFLGDAVLELLISDYLYLHKSIEEGEMTKLRAAYVCENALYEYALKINLPDYIMLGKGEEANGGKKRKTILADTFEALIGAIYLDKGLEEAKGFIQMTIIPYLKEETVFFKDYKSQLQEAVQTNKKSVIYDLIEESGPSHKKKFTYVVKVDGIVLGKGSSGSKKEAEQEAAKDAMRKAKKA